MEFFIGGLPRSIEGNVTALKPQTLEEAITITQRLMEQVIKHNYAQEANDHKQKFDDRRNTTDNNNYPKNRNNNNYQDNRNNNNRNHDHHQQNKRQETFRTYAATNGYTRNRLFCERCTLHHIGPCTAKCQTCNKIGLVLSSCFVFLVPSVGFISWLPVKRDLCADDSGGFFLIGSLLVSMGFWFPGGVVSGLVGFCISATITSGLLLAVVDNAGLVGAFIGIGIGSGAVEERFGGSCGGSSDSGSVGTRSVVWGGSCAVGVGRRSVGCCGGYGVKGNSVFGKMVSKTKYGLFEVLIVSKWNSKSTIKEFACSLKQVMEMVVVPSLMIALKQYWNFWYHFLPTGCALLVVPFFLEIDFVYGSV
ncbi:hypothetical protein Tco_0827120 [Tanacetum coccineum]